MTGDEYQAAVHKIVNEIDRLVIDPKKRTCFRNSIAKLCAMVEESGNHLEQCLNDPKLRIDVKAKEKLIEKMDRLHIEVNKLCHKFNAASQTGDQETVGQIDKLLKKKNRQYEKFATECNKPLAPGYVRYGYWDWGFLTVPHAKYPCWLKPGAVNPLLWFGIFGSASIQRKPTEDEKLMCHYVLLAVIHDYELRDSGTPTDSSICSDDYKGKWFERDRFYEEIGKYYHYPDQKATLKYCSATAREKLSQLNRAFEHVEKDLAGKQGNKRSIIGWIVEVIIALALLVICLYFFGIVTGIFIFAALLTILYYLGWLEPIRTFIYNIF
ncbi:hypothetical protein ES703_74772 [subsurface metagenome]